MLFLFALALVTTAAAISLTILSNKASEKLDSFDAGPSAGGLLSGAVQALGCRLYSERGSRF